MLDTPLNVQLYWTTTEKLGGAAIARLSEEMSPAELEQARRFHFDEDRATYVAAHVILRRGLRACLAGKGRCFGATHWAGRNWRRIGHRCRSASPIAAILPRAGLLMAWWLMARMSRSTLKTHNFRVRWVTSRSAGLRRRSVDWSPV
jgi:hypothetical protein